MPTLPTTGEMFAWFLIWAAFAQAGAKEAEKTTKKVLRVLSWVGVCGAISTLAILAHLTNWAFLIVFAAMFFLLFFPVSDVTTWRPWGRTQTR